MTLSIRTKLFLTLLIASALVVAGMLAFMRWSFERGLIELVDARQEERIARIGDRLTEIHRRDGGWERLRADKRLWVAALTGQERGASQQDGRHGPGWGWMRHGLDGAAWPPEHALRRHPRDGAPVPLELRLMLLAADGSIVYGRPELLPTTRRYPLVTDGVTVGELALLPGPSIGDLGEQRFQEHQTSALLLVALAMIALSAALSLPLSDRLARPLQGFQATARRLAAGDYSARVATMGNDELGRLGRDINALAEALERTEQARRCWVADISHELRTPLAVLRAELEALQDGLRPLDRAAVDSLLDDALRLGRLVDDLYELSMSDLGALGYRKTATDPTAVLAGDTTAIAGRFADAGLALTLDNRLGGPVTLQADGQRLSQLFGNLLRNSLQYTDAGGGLRIVLAREASDLAIDFQDTPPGVSPDDLPRLFERLFRVEGSRSRATGGAGLGLAICRNIVAAHGGTIEARPSPQGGLWIAIRLPLPA